jgi:hypothetical protein
MGGMVDLPTDVTIQRVESGVERDPQVHRELSA